MSAKKLCPLLSLRLPMKEGPLAGVECQEEQCGWFVRSGRACAVKIMGHRLYLEFWREASLDDMHDLGN
jgi:hypothetical protein